MRELQHVAGLGALVHHQLVVLFEEALQEDDDGGEEDDAEPDGQAKKKKFRWYKIYAIIKLDKLAVINFNIIT